MFVCASCHAYVVLFIMCWLLFPDCFFSIEFRNRSECEDSFDYVVSSSSWIRSSSKRDLRQDDHFPGYHYYHCHARCLVSIAMSRYLPHVCQPPKLPWKASNPSTSQHTIVWLCYRLLSPSYSVASCRCNVSMCQHGCFWAITILLLFNLMHIYTW